MPLSSPDSLPGSAKTDFLEIFWKWPLSTEELSALTLEEEPGSDYERKRRYPGR